MLRLLGARRLRHRVGPVRVTSHRLGPADGEPWVLLHGMGSTALSWYPALRPLAADCSVLAPELADLGGTETPHGALNVREGAAVVIDLLERRLASSGDRRPVVLAGNSLGGWIAVRVALERPDLVRALLLVACAGYRNQDWYRVRELLTVESLAQTDRLIEALFHRTRMPVRWARRAFRATYRSTGVRHVLSSISLEDSFDDDGLARLKMPVGLVWGTEDGLFPLEVARAMEAALPESRLFALPECAHVVPWDSPGAFADALAGFRSWLADPEPRPEERSGGCRLPPCTSPTS